LHRLCHDKGNNVLASDDGGMQWTSLPRIKQDGWSGGESVIAELANHSLLMETRVSVIGEYNSGALLHIDHTSAITDCCAAPAALC